MFEYADIAAQRIVRPRAGSGNDGELAGRAILLLQECAIADFRRGALGAEAPELVEAEIEAPRDEVQLAGDGGVIAVVLEDAGQEDLAVMGRDLVAGNAVDVRVAPAKGRRPRRRADRRHRVGGGEAHAFARDAVEVRRGDHRVAGAVHRIGSVFIGHQPENVRTGPVGALRGSQAGGSQQQFAAGNFSAHRNERILARFS